MGKRAWPLVVLEPAQLLAEVLGASVATGTLAAVLAEGAVGLDGFLATVRDRLAAAPVAHFDETGARVPGGCTGSTRPPPAC